MEPFVYHRSRLLQEGDAWGGGAVERRHRNHQAVRFVGAFAGGVFHEEPPGFGESVSDAKQLARESGAVFAADGGADREAPLFQFGAQSPRERSLEIGEAAPMSGLKGARCRT